MPNHFEKFESYIPFDLLVPQNFLLAAIVLTAIVLSRYFLIVFPFYWFWYKKSYFKSRQIYAELPGSREQWFEIRWSTLSAVVFGVTAVFIGVLWQQGWSQMYLRFNEYGWIYLVVVSPVLLMILQDTYFYWTHRLLHLPYFYKKFHAIHHASLKPSPWASFSFHPMESLINALALPLIVLILPLHPVVILVHLTLMTLFAITNHSGFEILPPGGWVSRVWISGIHHAQHHRYFKYNYGLFFSFWDLWMKTEHTEFSKQFTGKSSI